MNGVGRFIHVQRVFAIEMDERALCGRMVLDPLDLIGIDSNFLSASVKRDHLGHSCHLAEVTKNPKGRWRAKIGAGPRLVRTGGFELCAMSFVAAGVASFLCVGPLQEQALAIEAARKPAKL